MNKDMPAPEKEPSSQSTVPLPRTVVIGGATIFIALLVSLVGAFQFISLSSSAPFPQITPTHAPLVSYPTIAPVTQSTTKQFTTHLYVMDDAGIEKLISLSDVDSNQWSGRTPTITRTGEIYFVSNGMIRSYSLRNKTLTAIAPIDSYDDTNVSRITYLPPDMVYITITANDYYGTQIPHKILAVNIKTKQTRLIENINTTMYGGADYLFESSQGDIIGSFGGDSCGGWGEISRYENGNETLVAKTGLGCSDAPRYLGALPADDMIILASVSDSQEETDLGFPVYPYASLYQQHVVTGQSKVLYNLSEIQEPVTELLLNETKDKAAAFTKQTIYIINLKTQGIENQLPTPSEFDGTSYQSFTNDKIVYTHYNSDSVGYIEIATGNNTSNTWSTVTGNQYGGLPIILGSWNDTTILTKTDIY